MICPIGDFMKKTLVILLLIVVLTIGGSIAIPLLLNNDYDEIAYADPKHEADNKEDFSEITANKEEREDEESKVNKEKADEKIEDNQSLPQDTPPKQAGENHPPGSTAENKPIPQVPDLGSEVNDPWLQEQIDRNKDQIDEEDLKAGTEIYNHLDTEYLFGLMEGGLTEEEKVLFKEHLKANLSGAELDKMMELYNKYIGLVK